MQEEEEEESEGRGEGTEKRERESMRHEIGRQVKVHPQLSELERRRPRPLLLLLSPFHLLKVEHHTTSETICRVAAAQQHRKEERERERKLHLTHLSSLLCYRPLPFLFLSV